MSESTISYWDSQFKFSAILADFAPCLAWNQQHSAAFSESTTITQHSYASDVRQFVETVGEQSGKIIPVFIHGGYWRALSALEHRFALQGLAHIGPLVANVEYRLMPQVRLSQVVDDVAAALSLLVDKYCQDGAKLLLVGHSAGGHLAIAGALQANISEHIATVVSISGVYDLAPLKFSFLQPELNLSDSEITDFSLFKEASNLSFKLHLMVGENESAEFHRQAQMMQSLADAKLTIVKDTHHMSVLHPLAQQRSDLVDEILKSI